MTETKKNLLRTLVEILEELESDEEIESIKDIVSKKTGKLSNSQAKEALNDLIKVLLEEQEKIFKKSNSKE